MQTFYFLTASKEFSYDGIVFDTAPAPTTTRHTDSVVFNPNNGMAVKTIYPAIDNVYVDGTLRAPGYFTPLTLVTQLQTVFPKATTTGGGGSSTTDASQLTSGTLNDARLSSNVTTQGNTFNGNNQLVKIVNSKLPAVDGSLLTNLPAGSILPEKGSIITENFTSLTNWTTIAGTWTVGSNKLNIPNGANDFTTAGIRQSAYGSTKLRKWTVDIANYIIPTIGASSFGITVGIHSLSNANNSLGVRFCTDSTKKGLIEIYYNRSVATIYATSATALAISSGDSTSIKIKRIKQTIAVLWTNNTTGKSELFRFEMPANDSNAKPPNYGQFAIYANGGATTLDSFAVASNEIIGAKLWIQSDSIASTNTDNINQTYPEVLSRIVGEEIAVAFGNGDRIEENNWAEVLAHAPQNILISCITNNVSTGDSTATMLTKLASAIASLTGYTYGVNLFLTSIMNRNDVDVTAANTALVGAYANTIDLSTFKATSGTGIDSTRSLDGIHLIAEGHQDYALILLNYFIAKGTLTVKNNPNSYSRPVYMQGNKVRLGKGANIALGVNPLEIADDGTYSQLKILSPLTTSRSMGMGMSSDTFAHISLVNIAYENGQYVAKNTVFSAVIYSTGKLMFFGRTGATVGTAYTLDESSAAWTMSIDVANATGSVGGKIGYPKSITAAGSTGAKTINRVHGSVNFAAAATSLVVTNSLADLNSNIFVQVYGSDATATSARVTKAAGSFTITLNAAATAETAVGFWVIN